MYYYTPSEFIIDLKREMYTVYMPQKGLTRVLYKRTGRAIDFRPNSWERARHDGLSLK